MARGACPSPALPCRGQPLMTDEPPIETLGRGDAPELRVLSQAIGWTHTDDDWRTILEVGRVFGHRASDGGFLSSGALFEYGPSLASIGMILVPPPSPRPRFA